VTYLKQNYLAYVAEIDNIRDLAKHVKSDTNPAAKAAGP
jgi:hypothetical protein